MYAVSLSILINPEGIYPRLTQDQVWQGLIMKAENAVPFVPGMESCIILERYNDGILRKIKINGIIMKERVTFTPKIEVYFERVNSDENAGWISNVISESKEGLILTFTFAVNLNNVSKNPEEEKSEGEKMKIAYLSAVNATLKKIRDNAIAMM